MRSILIKEVVVLFLYSFKRPLIFVLSVDSYEIMCVSRHFEHLPQLF